MIGNALVIGFALFLVRFIATESRFQRARRTPTSVRFPVGLGLRLICRLGGPFLILVGYKMLERADNRFDQGSALLVAAIGMGCLVGEPGEIIVSEDELNQRSLLGLKRRTIRWGTAVARHTQALREVLVIGRDGTTITHSQYHVGQSDFLHELKRHQVQVQS